MAKFSDLIDKARGRRKVRGSIPPGYYPAPGSRLGSYRRWNPSKRAYDYKRFDSTGKLREMSPAEVASDSPSAQVDLFGASPPPEQAPGSTSGVRPEVELREETERERKAKKVEVDLPPLTPEQEIMALGDQLKGEDDVVVTRRVIDIILSLESLKLLKAIRAAVQSRLASRPERAPREKQEKKEKKPRKPREKKAPKDKAERTYTLSQLLKILDKRISELEAKSSDTDAGWDRMPDEDAPVSRGELDSWRAATRPAAAALAGAVLDPKGKPKKTASVEQMEALAVILSQEIEMIGRMEEPPAFARQAELLARLEVAIAAASEDTPAPETMPEAEPGRHGTKAPPTAETATPPALVRWFQGLDLPPAAPYSDGFGIRDASPENWFGHAPIDISPITNPLRHAAKYVAPTVEDRDRIFRVAAAYRDSLGTEPPPEWMARLPDSALLDVLRATHRYVGPNLGPGAEVDVGQPHLLSEEAFRKEAESDPAVGAMASLWPKLMGEVQRRLDQGIKVPDRPPKAGKRDIKETTALLGEVLSSIGGAASRRVLSSIMTALVDGRGPTTWRDRLSTGNRRIYELVRMGRRTPGEFWVLNAKGLEEYPLTETPSEDNFETMPEAEPATPAPEFSDEEFEERASSLAELVGIPVYEYQTGTKPGGGPVTVKKFNVGLTVRNYKDRFGNKPDPARVDAFVAAVAAEVAKLEGFPESQVREEIETAASESQVRARIGIKRLDIAIQQLITATKGRYPGDDAPGELRALELLRDYMLSEPAETPSEPVTYTGRKATYTSPSNGLKHEVEIVGEPVGGKVPIRSKAGNIARRSLDDLDFSAVETPAPETPSEDNFETMPETESELMAPEPSKLERKAEAAVAEFEQQIATRIDRLNDGQTEQGMYGSSLPIWRIIELLEKTADRISRKLDRQEVPEGDSFKQRLSQAVQRLKSAAAVSEAAEDNFETMPEAEREAMVQTILAQMGGIGAIKTMTGAREFETHADGVSFRFPNSDRERPNHVRVRYDRGRDLYDVEFSRLRSTKTGKVLDPVETHEGMYGDALKELFERQTGLDLTVPRIVFATPSEDNFETMPEAPPGITEGDARSAIQQEELEDAEVAAKVTAAMAAKKTKGQRKKDNEDALKLLQKIVNQGRMPTDEERVIIAGYSGQGGIGADLNQYYTRTDIASAMWDVMAVHGGPFERVLEPAVGSGVFMDAAPKGCKVTGVELDRKAAAVADILHGQTHEVVPASLEQFSIERMGRPLDYDAVITNAPFCVRTGQGTIPRHKTQFKSADRYFIDTSLDHVTDGGVVAMIVHSSVMNAKTPAAKAFRERILARAEVVDSFRLPGEAFAHSHTEPITDVIFLRKRDRRVGESLLQLQKQGQLAEKMEALGAWDQAFVDAGYYDDKPERILGTAMTSEETGWRDKVTGDPEIVAGRLRELALAKANEGKTDPAATSITFDQLVELGKMNTDVQAAIDKGLGTIEDTDFDPQLGNVRTVDGTRYLYVGDPPKWTQMETVDDVSQIIATSGDDAIQAAHDLSDDIRTLMAARDAGEYYRARAIRRRLEPKVLEWVEEHGLPGAHKSLGELSKSAPGLLDFIACVNADGQLSDLLSKDAAVTLKTADVDKTDPMSIARSTARKSQGFVNIDDIRENWETMPEGFTDSDIRRLLLDSGEFAFAPDARTNRMEKAPLQHIEDYLTGDLYQKLEQATEQQAKVGAEEREHYERQIAAIRERLDSKRKSIDDVPIQLRAMGWLPLDYFNAWLETEEGQQACLSFGQRRNTDKHKYRLAFRNGVYSLEMVVTKPYSRNTYRVGGEVLTRRFEVGDVVHTSAENTDWLKYLNRLSLRKEKAQDVERDVEAAFDDWLKSSDLRTSAEDIYNRTFHGDFRKEYSGDALGLEGLAGFITPHDYQNQAVRWAAETGRGILGQDVGLGKTFIAILLAKLRRQQGKSKRPMVVVPKSVATNWAEETETLFPGSKVLIIGETRYKAKRGRVVEKAKSDAIAQGLEPGSKEYADYVDKNSYTVRSDNDAERNRKLAMMKQNDYDLVICTKPAFDRIPLRESTTQAFEEEDFYYQRARALEASGSGNISTESRDKKIAKLKAAWSQAEAARKFGHEESLVYWEDLGVDCLMADEAHAYKNLYSARSRFGSNPKFLGGSGESKTARKMQLMSKVVRDKSPDNAVYFLTATPTKNSPLEVYNMLQHIAPDEFERVGIRNSEEFIDRFCKLEERLILTPPGRSGSKKTDDGPDYSDEFEGAGNMTTALCVTGFQNLKELESIMDKYMLIQTATDVGLKIPDANYQNHLVDMTDEQEAVYHQLRQEALDLDKDEDPGGMFRILDKMKKAAQDLELYDPEEYAGSYRNSPKYKACVNAAYEGATERGGQIIFCDHNASHERLKAMLMEKGLKEHEIGIINASVAKDSEARQRIGDKFNRNEIKVVIGNTGTMGEGVNLQGKKHAAGTTDIHHLDQPWDPGTLHQRNGRGVRQGNKAEQVQVHTYLATGSFDGFRHSILKGKERWLDKLRSGSDAIANDMEGQSLDDAEMLAMLSDDPDAALQRLQKVREDATSAFYARAAQESVDKFNRFQVKLSRYRRMTPDQPGREAMRESLEKLSRRLVSDDLLPEEIRSLVRSKGLDMPSVAVFAGQREEDGKFGATIFEVGSALVAKERYGKKEVILESLDVSRGKAVVRPIGLAYSETTVDLASLAAYAPLEGHGGARQELSEALGREGSYAQSPYERIWHMGDVSLRSLEREFREQAAKYYSFEKQSGQPVLIRDGDAVREVSSEEFRSGNLSGDNLLLPWIAEDRATLINAALDAMPGDEFNQYTNPVTRSARKMLSTDGIRSLVRDIETAAKKRKSK